MPAAATLRESTSAGMVSIRTMTAAPGTVCCAGHGGFSAVQCAYPVSLHHRPGLQLMRARWPLTAMVRVTEDWETTQSTTISGERWSAIWGDTQCGALRSHVPEICLSPISLLKCTSGSTAREFGQLNCALCASWELA